MHEVHYADQGVDSAGTAQQQLAAAASEIEHLKTALESARVIGAAIGIVMAMEKVTYDAAFKLLAAASQHGNRKLRDIADEVVSYGAILANHPMQVSLAS